jgi:hypothetical protein
VQELQVGRELHVDDLAQTPAQELGQAVEAGHHLGGAARNDHGARRRGRLALDLGRDAGPQGFDEANGMLEVGAHPYFGDGHRDALQGGIDQLFLAQDGHQGVANQFAGAELALRRTHGPALLVVGVALHGAVASMPGRRIERR